MARGPAPRTSSGCSRRHRPVPPREGDRAAAIVGGPGRRAGGPDRRPATNPSQSRSSRMACVERLRDSAPRRGPRSGGAPVARRRGGQCPRRRSRSRRGRGGGSPVGAGANRVHAATGRSPGSGRTRPACSVGAVGRSVPPRPVARLERPGRRHQPPVEREQVGLGERTRVGHRHPEQHLALALGVADRPPAGGGLGPAGLAGELGTLVEQADDPPVERVDPLAQPAQLGRLGGRQPSTPATRRRRRTAGRSTRARGGSRGRPARRSTRARCRGGS